MGAFDLLVGLANDHGSMRDHSHVEQALIRIQQDWKVVASQITPVLKNRRW